MAAERRDVRPRRRLGVALGVALACAAGVAPARAEPPRLALCESCHGSGGSSTAGETPSIAGQPAAFIENQLVLMREGLRDVPAMKAAVEGLSDGQIVALARHFAAQTLRPMAHLPKPEVRARGQALSQRALCGTCHLPAYQGQAQVPRLAGQNEAYLLQSMKQFRDHPGPGRDTIMAATLLGMTDPQLADLAHYLATTTP